MDTAKLNQPMPAKCPQCGTPLLGTLAGLCPACLLKAGAAADTISDAKQPAFQPPTVAELAAKFPQLEIIELIGKGGMGAVYKARQTQLDRYVALKILPPGIGDDPAFAERFTREAKALAKLNHPGIVTIYDFGRADGLFYFFMEYVDGVNLRQLLHAGRVSAREALAIVPQICDALQFAHDLGIVHRDIKPENILMDRRGRVKVADFGLAKIVGGGASEPAMPGQSAGGTPTLTESGKVMGTPQYMAPEQKKHPDSVDHRADIYALGVVFYQMLTGELPGKKIEPPSAKVHIDVRLDEIVLRALEKKPELRFQQASVLKTEVETIVTDAPPTGGAAQSTNPKPEIAAVENWLLLIDNGQYAQSWDTAASRFKNAISSEKWVERLQFTRDPLGRVQSRRLRQSRRLGPWLTATFDTVYEGKRTTVETLSFWREGDGQWRATGYLIVPAYADQPRSLSPVQNAISTVGSVIVAVLWLLLGWFAYSNSIFFNVLYFVIVFAGVIRCVLFVWNEAFGMLERGFWRNPFAPALRKHRWQLLNRWLFWILALVIVEICLVPPQFSAGQFTSMQIMLLGGAAFVLLMEAFPGKRIYVATNLVYALGSIFFITQLAIIYWPVSPSEGVVLSAPFRGEWLVLHGGKSALINGHQLVGNQRDALDIERLINGRERSGPENSLASYPSWNETIFAPADGTVTEVENGLEDNPIGQYDTDNPAGNHVVIDIGHGHYVMMAHFKKGSLLVAPGDVVHTGQPIGKCGHSGNTSHPHLHIQVQDQPKFTDEDMKTFPIFFKDATCFHGSHQRSNSPFFARRNDHFIRQPEPGESDFIGHTFFPHEDLIEISSVDRNANRIIVKGNYQLKSQDKATLALYITSNFSFPGADESHQHMEISKGVGDFELVKSNLVDGMPHLSMYASGHPFATAYFGTKTEAAASEKMNIEDGQMRPATASTFQQRLEKIVKAAPTVEMADQPATSQYPGDWIWEPNSTTLDRVPPVFILRPSTLPSSSQPFEMYGKDRFLARGKTLKDLIAIVWSQKNSALKVLFHGNFPGDQFDCIITAQTNWWNNLQSEIYRRYNLEEKVNPTSVIVIKRPVVAAGTFDPSTGLPVGAPVNPATGLPAGATINPVTGLPVNSTINPATGLPEGPVVLDPATGLPVSSNSGDSTSSTEAWSPNFLPGEKPDLQKLMADAKIAMDRHDYEGSLQRHLWFHQHEAEYGDPYQDVVRITSAISDWVELGRRYPKAKAALLQIRDQDTQALKEGNGYLDLFKDVNAINHELGADDDTYALYKMIREKDPSLAGQCYFWIEGLLVSKGEYQWCYDHMGDPQARFNSARRSYDMQIDNEKRMAENQKRSQKMIVDINRQHGWTNAPLFSPPDTSGMLTKAAENQFIGQVRQLVEILVGTGHRDTAQNIVEQATSVLDDARLKSAITDAEQKIHGQH